MAGIEDLQGYESAEIKITHPLDALEQRIEALESNNKRLEALVLAFSRPRFSESTHDQQEYLAKVREAEGNYDPSVVVGGPTLSPEDIQRLRVLTGNLIGVAPSTAVETMVLEMCQILGMGS